MAPAQERRSDLTGSKRKAGAPSSASQDGDGPASKRRKLPDFDQDPVEQATKTGYALLKRLKEARDKKNWAIATHFLTLPDRKLLPDYYEQTGLPIALDTIEGKLERKEYENVSTLESDVKRMISNAKSYNEKTSQVFSDAEKIRKMVSVFMEDNNPAYKTAGYQPVPTPVPDGWRNIVKKETKAAEDAPHAEETINTTRGSRRSGRNPAPSPVIANYNVKDSAKDNRRASSTPAVKDAEGAGETFEGDTFQQAQEKIITEMMNLTDDDNNLISANFLNLPSRTLQDYYRVIKHPVSLKSLNKTVQGIRGRDPPTGTSLMKSWDAFENEVGYIWRNAREYNEDGSAIVELAEELREYFEKRLKEAKRFVAEPPQPKVKLTMKAAQEPPKITLKFGSQRPNGTAGVTVDQEALGRQQSLVRAAANGQAANGAPQHAARNQLPTPASAAAGRASQDLLSSGPGEHGPLMNGIKREGSHAQSPALGKVMPNGIGEGGHQPMPPPVNQTSQNATHSEHPGAVNGHTYGAPVLNSAMSTNSHKRPPGKDVSDAIITNLNISTHPDLRDLPQRFNLNIPASPTQTQQSITISLSRRQWRLLISPTLSSSLLHRPSRTFVTCNNRRVQALAQPELDQRRPIYEHKLVPGTNTIEVEVIAGMPRGALKTGTGQEIELERFVVFAHYKQ